MGPRQSALHNSRSEPVGRQREADRCLAPAETGDAPERPDRRIDRGCEEIDEHHGEERNHAAIFRKHLERAHGIGPRQREGPPLFARQRFRQHEIAIDEVQPRNARSYKKRHARTEFAKQPANRRSDDEAEPESSPHHAEGLGAIFRRRDVGEIGIGRRIRGPAQSCDDAANEQPDHRRRKRGEQIIDSQPSDREQQHRPPSIGVGERLPITGPNRNCIPP